MVRELLQNGADVNAAGSRVGGTPLHGATPRNHIAVMRLLLESGADPSKADFKKVTPLYSAAARMENPEAVMLLLEYRAAKDAVDSLGETPLDWAIMAGKGVSVKLLRGGKCDLEGIKVVEKEVRVYCRATASFPSLAVAQGLALSPLRRLTLVM